MMDMADSSISDAWCAGLLVTETEVVYRKWEDSAGKKGVGSAV